MRQIKTTLPERITSLEEAKKYLTALYNNGESYHPDDDAADCLQGISKKDAKNMDSLMDQVCEIFKDNKEDVYLFILGLSGHVMED